MSQSEKTHFGYQEVPKDEKAKLVADVFQKVAPRYDLMNDLMSLGLHRWWKKFTINQANIRPHDKILDVASGTGDLAKSFAQRIKSPGKVIMTDINSAMLTIGRDHLINAGLLAQVEFVEADAEHLPFRANYFDLVTIAFGLRNVTDKMAALHAMYEVLKPGGKLFILEFSQPTSPLMNKIYDLYSFNVIPKLGEFIAHDKKSYDYLVESIRKHPNQETLKKMLEEAGFMDVNYHNLTNGIVALHIGYKY